MKILRYLFAIAALLPVASFDVCAEERATASVKPSEPPFSMICPEVGAQTPILVAPQLQKIDKNLSVLRGFAIANCSKTPRTYSRQPGDLVVTLETEEGGKWRSVASFTSVVAHLSMPVRVEPSGRMEVMNLFCHMNEVIGRFRITVSSGTFGQIMGAPFNAVGDYSSNREQGR